MLTAIDFSVQPVLQANFEKYKENKQKIIKIPVPSVQIYSH